MLTELATKLEGARFVAHNAEFDLAFLRKAAKRSGVELRFADPLCTLRLSRQLDPDRSMSHRLGDICERCGIHLAQPHTALADADATAAVLPHLLQAHSIATVDQLPAMPFTS